ncbi:NrsF family protein [Niveispirillum irakense]|uniref:NrsF family protein n=1 Tax=Niveispirillum irakense TaxID=34011 RepID=UPI000429B11E|nr:NrsF family protein [Niveispirillum irakense]
MMDETSLLIERLSREAKPVRRLPTLPLRLVVWLALSIALILGVSVFHGIRPDLLAMAGDPLWLLQQGLTLGTALTAALCAQSLGIPGNGRWPWRLWLCMLAGWTLAIQIDLSGMAGPPEAMASDWELFCPYCFPIIAIGSSLGLYADIRRAAPLAPLRTMVTLAIASTAMGIFGERLIHDDLDAPLLLLIQILTILAAAAVMAPLGRALFRWRNGRIPRNLQGE